MLLNKIVNFLSTAATTPQAEAATPSIDFKPERFLDMLPYMLKGMLVIFVLIGVIILVTMLINKVFKEKK